MRIGISARMFLAVLDTAAVVVVLLGGASRWNFERGFLGYLNKLAVERMGFVQPRLERADAEKGSWDFVPADPLEAQYMALLPIAVTAAIDEMFTTRPVRPS